MNLKNYITISLSGVVTIFLLLLFGFTAPVSALGGKYDVDMFSGNNIQFYNPEALGICSTNTGSLLTGNSDYAGNKILNAAQLQSIENNKPFYEAAGSAHSVPWELLAAIHFRETGLKRYGPSNENGPFQIIGKKYPVKDSYSDEEFRLAANDAAEFIRTNKAGDRDLSDINNIKYVLFAYNGRAEVFIQQALNLGFSEAEAERGEGSPYVMNRADLIRDPTQEPTKSNETWGQIKIDYGEIEYPANNDYGAFIVYASLAGIDLGGDCNDSGLIDGGMTFEQAQEFMSTYTNSSDSVNYIGSASRSCNGGALSNCSSFSAYFVNKYTSLEVFKTGPVRNVGNGSVVATNITSRDSRVQGGSTPQVYSVFSYDFGITQCGSTLCGHTGVVLGIDTNEGKIIIGDASCSSSHKGGVAREYTLEAFASKNPRYAHVGEFLKSNSGITGGGNG